MDKKSWEPSEYEILARAVDKSIGEILQRLKILEAAYAVQNKKLRELTRPPQSDKLTKS